MSIPPSQRARPIPDDPTWRAVLVSYAAMVAIPLALWVGSQPLVRGVALAGVVGALVGARRALELLRCLSECGGFALDLGETVRITVARNAVDDPS